MTDHRKTAVYIRLSAEDDNVDGRAKKESDSITSQRILLNGESAHLGLLSYEFMCTTRARSTRVLQYCHFDNFVLLTSSRLDGDYVPIPT